MTAADYLQLLNPEERSKLEVLLEKAFIRLHAEILCKPFCKIILHRSLRVALRKSCKFLILYMREILQNVNLSFCHITKLHEDGHCGLLDYF